MKKLLATCLLSLASLLGSATALSQATTYAAYEGIHWIDGQTVTITYSHNGAPAVFSQAAVIQVLAQVEAKLNSLGLQGLQVRIGQTDLPNACAHQARNTVHVCWEVRDGRRADSINTGRTDGSDFWREGIIIFGNQADWTDPTRPLYQQMQHYLLHILGFSHPPRDGFPSVINNNTMDLSDIDIQGLRDMYTSSRCAVTYNYGVLSVPFVKYRGVAYTGQIQRDANGFSVVPGTLGYYGNQSYNATPIPTSPCQGLQIDGSNEFHFPQVWVNGSLQWMTLRFANGRFSVTASSFL